MALTREQRRAYNQEYYKRNSERVRQRALDWYYENGGNAARRLKRFGLTQEQYDKLLADQGGFCAICLTSDVSVIDHDHGTQKVRGLLCKHCNLGLGHFRDSAAAMRRAIAYLDQAMKERK